MICTLRPVLFEKNEMGGAYSTYGGEVRLIQILVGKTEKKRKEVTWGTQA